MNVCTIYDVSNESTLWWKHQSGLKPMYKNVASAGPSYAKYSLKSIKPFMQGTYSYRISYCTLYVQFMVTLYLF